MIKKNLIRVFFYFFIVMVFSGDDLGACPLGDYPDKAFCHVFVLKLFFSLPSWKERRRPRSRTMWDWS